MATLTDAITLLRAGLEASWLRLLSCPGDDFLRAVECHRAARDLLDRAADLRAELDEANSSLDHHVEMGEEWLRGLHAVCDALGARAKRSDPLPEIAELVAVATGLRTTHGILTVERDRAREECRMRATAVGALAAGRVPDFDDLAAGGLDGCAIEALRRIVTRLRDGRDASEALSLLRSAIATLAQTGTVDVDPALALAVGPVTASDLRAIGARSSTGRG